MITSAASTKGGAIKEAVAVALLSNPATFKLVQDAAQQKRTDIWDELVTLSAVIATKIAAADA